VTVSAIDVSKGEDKALALLNKEAQLLFASLNIETDRVRGVGIHVRVFR
jgi:hypothetical protein